MSMGSVSGKVLLMAAVIFLTAFQRNTFSEGRTTHAFTETYTSSFTQEIELAVLKYTNLERQSRNLPAFVTDNKLAVIALEHTIDMAKHNYFDHTNLKGESPTDRAKRHGYHVFKTPDNRIYYIGIGENIRYESENTGKLNADQLGKSMVNAWMNSKGHRENILSIKYSNIGIGVCRKTDPTYGNMFYSTQNFF